MFITLKRENLILYYKYPLLIIKTLFNENAYLAIVNLP